MTKIIHLFGLNAGGKSTLLKELEGEFLKENIKVVREHNVSSVKKQFQEELAQYNAENGKNNKKSEKSDHEKNVEKLRHEHITSLLGMSNTVHSILEAVTKKHDAVILEGNCLPCVENLMHCVNNKKSFDPSNFPVIPSIYLEVSPEIAARRNIRRMSDYYTFTPEQIEELTKDNISYQKSQEEAYAKLARAHKSKTVVSTTSIEQTAKNLKTAILELIDHH